MSAELRDLQESMFRQLDEVIDTAKKAGRKTGLLESIGLFRQAKEKTLAEKGEACLLLLNLLEEYFVDLVVEAGVDPEEVDDER